MSREGMRATLWRVDGRGAPGRVGRLPDVIGAPVAGDAHWLAPTYGDRGLVMVDVAGRRGVRVALPDSGMPREVVETPAGVAVLSDRWNGAGARSEVVLYTLGDAATREPAQSRSPERSERGARGAPPEHHDTTGAAPDHHPSNADRVPASPRDRRPSRR